MEPLERFIDDQDTHEYMKVVEEMEDLVQDALSNPDPSKHWTLDELDANILPIYARVFNT